MNPAVQDEAWWGMGDPQAGGVLIVGDHASNFVPTDIDLGIDPVLRDLHIASDIGVAGVARQLIDRGEADTAFLGGVSRLVIDLNRDECAHGLIPRVSDGHAIPGNEVSDAERAERIDRFHRPYHATLANLLIRARPAMILSLHSFTPTLATKPAVARPWEIGILYNRDDRLARIAIPALAALSLNIGDQLPYSGRELNYTMDRHAEGNAIPYLGVEMRQDLVADTAGIARMADWLSVALHACRNFLAYPAALTT